MLTKFTKSLGNLQCRAVSLKLEQLVLKIERHQKSLRSSARICEAFTLEILKIAFALLFTSFEVVQTRIFNESLK